MRQDKRRADYRPQQDAIRQPSWRPESVQDIPSLSADDARAVAREAGINLTDGE